MIYFIAGLFFGSIAAMMLYSVVVSGRINNLEDQNKDLRAYKCMYHSSYEGFENMRKKEIK